MRALSLLLLILAACGDDSAPPAEDAGPPPAVDAGVTDAGPTEAEFEVAGYCPGGEGCADEGDGVLHAGVGMRDITPVITDTTDIMTVDVNGDGVWDPFDGDEFEDRDGDGRFKGIWIAGFGNPRVASGSHDPQWTRALALRQNETTLVVVASDTFSMFLDYVDRIRERVADLDVDFVVVCASHSHQATDNLGIYGLDETISGADPEYLELFEAQTEAAIRDAVADLRPAHVQYGSFRFRDQPGGTTRYVSDARHPRIIDDEARLLRLVDAEDEATIATVVNFAAHAEYWGSRNTLLSSDFPHWLRQGIEEGVTGPDGEEVPGLGGMAFFLEGALGSQIGPGEIEPATWEGDAVEEDSMESARNFGEQAAYFVLEALGEDGGSETDETADLGYRNARFLVDVQNEGFHVAFLNELFYREGFNWDPDQILRSGLNEPDIRTEVGILDVGRMQLMLVGAEIDPALFVGGYDGVSYTPEDVEFVEEDIENAPDIGMAPEGPYLRDLAREDAEYVGIVSLANDHIGYLLPDFDYVLDPRNPYIDEAPGEHYEETNSIGVDGWQRVKSQMEQLLAWEP